MMRRYLSVCRSTFFAALVASTICAVPAKADYFGPVISYQGRLMQNGQPASGTYDIAVRIYNAANGGNLVEVPQLVPSVAINDGLFTIDVVSNGNVFDGSARYLEFEIRNPGSQSGEVLSPRQSVRNTPYADYAFKTRGINVWPDDSFVGIGRTTRISSAERFGIHTNTASYGGMYISTNENGLPFYGYATNDNANAWHYYDPGTYAWRLNINNGQRFSVNRNGHATFGDPASQTALRIAPTEDRVRIWKETAGVSAALIDISDRILFNVYNVGINEDEPTARLSVSEYNNHTAAFNRRGTDGPVILIDNDGVVAGTISVSGSTVSYNAFTGSHYARSDDNAIERGMLLSMTGDNSRMGNMADGECIHGVQASQKANDPAIIGAHNGLHDAGKPASDENPILAMAEGNGDIWVVDDGRGNLKPGDLLIASDIRGCAMLDDPKRFSSGNIVARAAQKLNWASIAPDQDGRKRALVAVLFDRSTRGGGSELAERLAEQEHEIEQLKAAIAKLAGENN